MGERERLFGSREREGNWKSHSRFTGREQELDNATGREGKGNLRLVIPGIPRNPGNYIKSKVKFKILFIFMPWPAIRKTANDNISRPNSRQKLPFPGNGKGNYKMPREGKGGEIWGLYSRESRETGIPAHPCLIINKIFRLFWMHEKMNWDIQNIYFLNYVMLCFLGNLAFIFITGAAAALSFPSQVSQRIFWTPLSQVYGKMRMLELIWKGQNMSTTDM